MIDVELKNLLYMSEYFQAIDRQVRIKKLS